MSYADIFGLAAVALFILAAFFIGRIWGWGIGYDEAVRLAAEQAKYEAERRLSWVGMQETAKAHPPGSFFDCAGEQGKFKEPCEWPNCDCERAANANVR